MNQLNLSFVGAGRVASSLCREMYNAGHKIKLVVSETEKRGKLLAGYCNSKWSASPIFPDNTDVIIVSVPDHKLKNVLDQIKCNPETLVVHTAGSIGIDVFPEQIKRKGVFYPLQTFSSERKINFRGLPFFLESVDEQGVRYY